MRNIYEEIYEEIYKESYARCSSDKSGVTADSKLKVILIKCMNQQLNQKLDDINNW